MPILDGKALKEARVKKGWSQFELHENTRPNPVDVSTISRIERGKSTRVRSNTLKALSKALEVDPSRLRPAAGREQDVMKINIETAARNALTLVARRYGIRSERVVEIAPLLFFLAAEQSLKERQSRIADIQTSGDALLDLFLKAPHLPLVMPFDDQVVSSEKKSIETRDIFGESVRENAQQFSGVWDDDFDEAKHNPFIVFLQDSLRKIEMSNDIVTSVEWTPGMGPRYQIYAEEAASFVGNDKKAIHAILCGAAPLHEMPKGSPEERAAWASAAFDRKYPDDEDLLEDLAKPQIANVESPESRKAL